jgi:hypothetical protein
MQSPVWDFREKAMTIECGKPGRGGNLPLGAVVLGVSLLTALAAGAQELDFFTLTACRLYDTRWGSGPLAGGFDRWIPAGGYCGIPPDASAVAGNFTVVDPNANALLSAYPCCLVRNNVVQSLQTNRNLAGQAVLALGTEGRLGAYVQAGFSTTTDLVVDVSGYFRPPAEVQQWREWEAALVSPEDYTADGGDPYSEVTLSVRFSNAATGETFLQPAFWDDDDLAPRVFKVRMALPAGSWTWQIESCTHNGVSCLSGWAPSQGTIFVQSDTSSGNPLYDRGFVEQVKTVIGGQTVAFSELKYPDGLSFAWVGDTVWTAPVREYDPDGSGPQTAQTSAWDAFLADRKSKGFSGLQIAPAVAWPLARPLPSPKGFSFTKKSTCDDATAAATPIPNTKCWKPRKAYWDHFKKLVRKANDAGMVVAVFGLMNPVGIDVDEAYPNAKSAQNFALYLAGVLGGLNVIYSPAFDDDADKVDPGTGQVRSVLMNAVGQKLSEERTKSGKVWPLTNHLSGGRSNCDEYLAFASSGWMTHYLFQSGHGTANDTSGPCAASGNNYIENAMMRARVMPWTLSTYSPKLPAINAEGPYDAAFFSGNVPHPEVDTRYRVRQAGYLSALSNAVGYTYGAHGLTVWDDPSGTVPGEPAGYFVLPSSTDMQRLKENLQGRHLVSHPEWIKNNPTVERYKMVLATDEVSFVMAYLPGDEGAKGESSAEIRIDATKLPCQICPSPNSSPWSFTWVNPVTNLTGSGNCSGPAGGQLTFSRPPCDDTFNPSCDWLLKIEKTGACPSAATEFSSIPAVGAWSALEVWDDTSAGDGTSAIYAASRGPAGPEEPILLSPPGKAFQMAPRVDRLAGGHRLVIWQADGLDGSLFGIFGALVGPRGEVAGPFKINSYTEHDQREPAVAGGVRGDALVVWSSYGQDGDRAGIFGRLVDARGRNEDDVRYGLGEEAEISEERGGHQQHPQVVADAGGFWVAWETIDDNGLTQGLSVRRLGKDGRPESAELRLPAEAGEQRKLMTLDRPTPDSVVVRWWRQSARGGLLEPLQQVIGPHGALGPVLPGRDQSCHNIAKLCSLQE